MNIAIVCEACGTRAEVSPDRLGDALQRHNERRHDGDAVAYVDPAHFDRLQ